MLSVSRCFLVVFYVKFLEILLFYMVIKIDDCGNFVLFFLFSCDPWNYIQGNILLSILSGSKHIVEVR